MLQLQLLWQQASAGAFGEHSAETLTERQRVHNLSVAPQPHEQTDSSYCAKALPALSYYGCTNANGATNAPQPERWFNVILYSYWKATAVVLLPLMTWACVWLCCCLTCSCVTWCVCVCVNCMLSVAFHKETIASMVRFGHVGPMIWKHTIVNYHTQHQSLQRADSWLLLCS